MSYISNIPGFSHYHIDKLGRLFSNFRGSWREVKPVIKDCGYVSNNLISDSGRRYNKYRHRLVAEVFLSNPLGLAQVCHKDNNPLNNRLENLYWGTPRDNMQQAIKDNRFFFVGYFREKHLPEEALVRDYLRGIPRKILLQKYHISVGVFYKILKKHQVKLRYERRKNKRSI